LRTEVAALPSSVITLGYSVEGRALTARRFGEGERVLMLVGGMHGGWEANTVDLIEALSAHFEAHPEDIQPGLSLVLVAVANPDGLPHGRSEAGRFNANGVDLNRNWGCEWSAEAVWRSQRVNPGVTAFSEPESRALAESIRTLRPAAVLFYHSAANGVYAGECDGDMTADSEALAAVLGEATGYRYGQPFSAYTVTGTAPNWVDGLGIPSVDVELRTWTDAEFEANLRGVLAVQRWLLGSA
jgi:predicted deacylase